MKILLTADPFIPVPPIEYGGIERVIYMLIDGYVQCGHDVILLAHKDSHHEKLTQRFSWPHEQPKRIQNLVNAFTLRRVVRKTQPDVIHSFSRLQTCCPSGGPQTPSLFSATSAKYRQRPPRWLPESFLHIASSSVHVGHI